MFKDIPERPQEKDILYNWYDNIN